MVPMVWTVLLEAGDDDDDDCCDGDGVDNLLRDLNNPGMLMILR